MRWNFRTWNDGLVTTLSMMFMSGCFVLKVVHIESTGMVGMLCEFISQHVVLPLNGKNLGNIRDGLKQYLL